MYRHRMTVQELDRAVKGAVAVAGEIGSAQPETAKLILDAVELACLELLVHACGGDREIAEKMHQQMNASRKG
jgi:hypothetical protein